jgi:hypothetical protein
MLGRGKIDAGMLHSAAIASGLSGPPNCDGVPLLLRMENPITHDIAKCQRRIFSFAQRITVSLQKVCSCKTFRNNDALHHRESNTPITSDHYERMKYHS